LRHYLGICLKQLRTKKALNENIRYPPVSERDACQKEILIVIIRVKFLVLEIVLEML
jgi:hypothetical protein